MNEELELKDLTERVIAVGGRAGRKAGTFLFDYAESDGYKAGDQHDIIEGLYYWHRGASANYSRWMDFKRVNDRLKSQKKKQREYYEKNRNSILSQCKSYREENREIISKKRKEYYDHNKELILKHRRHYREENKDAISKRGKYYYQQNKELILVKNGNYRSENREAISQRAKEYYERNKGRAIANNAKRRARMLEAIDLNANRFIINSRYEAAKYMGDVTGFNWEVDHTKTLKSGGKEHEDNLQVVPMSWNRRKGARHNDRWFEDSDLYRYATAVEKRFEREAIEAQGD